MGGHGPYRPVCCAAPRSPVVVAVPGFLWTVKLAFQLASSSAHTTCATLAPMRGCAMSQIVLDAEAGQVSAELARRGIPPHTRVHVLVEVTLGGELPITAIAQAGKGLDWLDEEPELYSDADLIEPAR